MRGLNLILRVGNIRVDEYLLQDPLGTYFRHCYGIVLGIRICPAYAELLMPPRPAVVLSMCFRTEIGILGPSSQSQSL